MPKTPSVTRRTQVERSAATVTRLLESTVDAIVELGYDGATTREICERAGVSQGGLFRHFPTRLGLVAAAVEYVYEEQLERLRMLLDNTPADTGREGALAQMRVVRDVIRMPRYMVFLEVMLAGRTEPELVAALHPLIVRQNEDLCAAARNNPVFARLSDESQQVMKDIAQHTLALEILWRPTLPEPDLDEVKLEALIDLLFLVDATERRERDAN